MIMNRYLSACILILVLLHADTSSAQALSRDSVVNAVMKCWRVFSREYAEIYGLEDEEVKAFSKQRVCFGKDSISTFRAVQYKPAYRVTRVNAEDYAQQNYDCSKRKLNIYKDSVYEVVVRTETKPTRDKPAYKLTDIVLYDGESLFITVDGVTFKMLDADAKVRGASAN